MTKTVPRSFQDFFLQNYWVFCCVQTVFTGVLSVISVKIAIHLESVTILAFIYHETIKLILQNYRFKLFNSSKCDIQNVTIFFNCQNVHYINKHFTSSLLPFNQDTVISSTPTLFLEFRRMFLCYQQIKYIQIPAVSLTHYRRSS